MNAAPLDALLAALRARSGFAADAVDRGRLEAALVARARGAGRGVDADAEAARVLADAAEYAVVEALFAPPETWLFRYPASYEALRTRFKGRTAPMRALVAGCGGFAEPASLAAALLSTVAASCTVRVDAFDRNPQLVRDDRMVFTGMLVRGGVPPWAETCFERGDAGLAMSPRLRAAVRARCGSVEDVVAELAREGARFDVVFFRNVAIYLDAARRRTAYSGLASLLAADGVFLVGHAEMHAAAEATGLVPESDAGAFMLAASRASAGRAGPATMAAGQGEPRAAPRAAPANRPPASRRAEVAASIPTNQRLESPSADALAAEAEERFARGDHEGAWSAATKALYLDQAHEPALLLAARIAEARGDDAGAERFRARAMKAHLRAAERGDEGA